MADRSCQECRELISAFIDGEATAEENSRLRQHLATCADCRATLDAYRGIGGTLRTLPSVHPPYHLTESIFAQTIDSEPRRLFLITSRLGYSLAAVAAVLLIFVVAGYLIIGGYERGIQPAVASSQPPQDQTWPVQQPVEIKFNKEMNHESVTAALGIFPSGEEKRLTTTWDGNTLIIGANPPFKSNTGYEIKISTDATDKWGNHLAQPFELKFTTTSSLTTVQTPTPEPTLTSTVEIAKPTQPSDATEPAVIASPTSQAENPAPPTATQNDGPRPGTGDDTPSTPAEPIVPVEPTDTPTPRPTLTPTPTEPSRVVVPTETPTPSPTATVTPVPPTATATATATVTPTPTVAITPTPDTVPVIGAIGDIYWSDQTVQDRLGEPVAAETTFPTEQLDFQRGVMLVDESGASIYVLKVGSGWDRFTMPTDDYPVPELQPEGDVYSPGSYFGALWQANPSVSDEIGFALTRDPIGYTAEIQRFDSGVMIATPTTIYVIYGDNTWDWFAYTAS